MGRGAQETISLDDVVENIITKIDKKEIDSYEVGE
jgi:hypothetical protein